MKIRFLILAALVAASPALALDLKGVELGKTATPDQLHQAFGITFGPYECDMVPNRPCIGGTRIEGVPCGVEVQFGADKIIVRIVVNFLSDYFETLAPAAIAKWGKPQESGAVPQQNGYGAQVLNQVRGWTLPDGSSVGLVKYAADVGHGMLWLKALPDPKPTNDGKL
jgi:hypothetical protein